MFIRVKIQHKIGVTANISCFLVNLIHIYDSFYPGLLLLLSDLQTRQLLNADDNARTQTNHA